MKVDGTELDLGPKAISDSPALKTTKHAALLPKILIAQFGHNLPQSQQVDGSDWTNMAGKLFDDWREGEEIAHEIRRTVTETDNLLFSTLTHNPQPLHIDAQAAAESEFGQILVNGTFTFSLMVGLSVSDTTLGVLVANLGYDKLKMPNPVFIGDTLRATTKVVSLRVSNSRPNAGIVTFEHALLNQDGKVVCSCNRSALIHKGGDKHAD